MEKWLFCDFDGTLRNGSDGGVDRKDSDFVHDWMNHKNKFVIASGRPYAMMLHEMNAIDVKPDAFITNAGALIFDAKGQLLFKRTIPREYNKPLVEYIKSMNLSSLIYATPEGEFYLFSDKPSRYSDGTLKREIVNKPYEYLYDQDLVCFKIIDTRKKLDALLDFVHTNFPELSTINNKDTLLVEIHPTDSNKAKAVKKCQEIYDIKNEQVYVAGDDDNDTEMMESYDNSFCVKHSYNQEIQTHAKHVIDSLSDIKKYLK